MSLLIGPDTTFNKMGCVLANRAGVAHVKTCFVWILKKADFWQRNAASAPVSQEPIICARVLLVGKPVELQPARANAMSVKRHLAK